MLRQARDQDRAIRVLLGMSRRTLEERRKDDVIDLALFLKRVLLRYANVTCGAEEAAAMFRKKRSWVYDAMSRPATPLQRAVAAIACRESGGLLFRLSDLVSLREQLFTGGIEPKSIE